jgi:hypothetical protein
MIVPHEFEPLSRKERIIKDAILITVIAVFSAIMITQIAIPLYNYQYAQHSAEYVTAVGAHSVWLASPTDHGDWHYGNYTLANGVTLPSEIIKEGRGWVYASFNWDVITKVEPYD